MNALDLLRSVTGSDESEERPHESHRLQAEYDDLEPRQLLSALQSTTSSLSTQSASVGTTTPASTTAELGTQVPGGSSVVTQAVGDINSLQSQVPVNDILDNLSAVTDDVYAPGGTPISVASGLTSLPITPILPPSMTANETPLNNGTFDPGTVWITMPPETPGVFHLTSTEIPYTSNTMQQMVNPQGGPPTFTHFGQGANGSMNGAATNQPVAVGPVGPSMTEEIEPVQPPPVEGHQPVGPPTIIQQDETTTQPNGQTPPGGQEGAGQPGTPGQGAAPGQPSTSSQGHQRSAGGATTQGAQTTTPHVPAGQNLQGGGNLGQGQPGAGAQGPAGGAQGGTGGSGGSGAFLLRPGPDLPGPSGEPPVDLIDAAIPALVANPDQPPDDTHDAGALPTAFGAAAVVIGGLHLAHRDARSTRRGLVAGSSEAGDPHSRRDPSAH